MTGTLWRGSLIIRQAGGLVHASSIPDMLEHGSAILAITPKLEHLTLSDIVPQVRRTDSVAPRTS